MAKCAVCAKQSSSGHNVSHSNRHTKTRWYPNLHRMRVERNGERQRIYICTRCLRTLHKPQLKV